ncbi:GntR family transcriptional regulator [Arthrobacter sp. K5]|uniref:GntR family transcriptional regulator n=1 Tax=Arthrobacter sp. K5 TaxID=2839623 RepID=A0AAU8EYW0_9MICC
METIRDAILYGTLEPGQKLVERELCAMLDVSRTLLREALRQLQAEGLITNVMHKGPSVAVITKDVAQEIYEIRQLLEGQLTYNFALRATDEQIDELDKAVQQLWEPGMADNAQLLLQTKNSFYDVLMAGSGNGTIAQLLVQLTNRVTLLRRKSLAAPGRVDAMRTELASIVEAVRARDPEAAAQRCREHVARAGEIILASFDSHAAGETANDLEKTAV